MNLQSYTLAEHIITQQLADIQGLPIVSKRNLFNKTTTPARVIKSWLKKDWVRRLLKFARYHFNSNIKEATYCLKDVSNLHLWERLKLSYVDIDWSTVIEENAFYERIFSKELCAHLLAIHTEFETGPPPSLAKNITVIEFDHLFTAPRCGFKDALDYYKACSSAQFVSKIKIPCKILFSKDDPLICHSTLDTLVLPKNVQIFKTEKGGHLGFLGNPFSKRGLRWLDSLLVEWIL